jgi:hypothetical protein
VVVVFIVEEGLARERVFKLWVHEGRLGGEYRRVWSACVEVMLQLPSGDTASACLHSHRVVRRPVDV